MDGELDKLLEARAERELFANIRNKSALLCLYYPQYTYEQSCDMPLSDKEELLRVAALRDTEKSIELLAIAASSRHQKSYNSLHGKLITRRKKLIGS